MRLRNVPGASVPSVSLKIMNSVYSVHTNQYRRGRV